MSLEFVLPMSLEFSVTYVPERFNPAQENTIHDEIASLRHIDSMRLCLKESLP